MAKDLATVVQFYVDRLALQYRGLPKASATIAILLKQAVADFMAEDLAEAFNLDTAVGPQLDILAKYIGVPRRSNVPGTIEYFGYALVAGGGSVNATLSARYDASHAAGVLERARELQASGGPITVTCALAVMERAVKAAGTEDVEGAAHGLAEAVRTSYGDEGAAFVRGEDNGGTGS